MYRERFARAFRTITRARSPAPGAPTRWCRADAAAQEVTMPVKPTYPGVYIEEIPSGVRTITGVATSVGAFIGTFRKGPRDEAVQIFSMADFERVYGGLERTSEVSYAVQQFFLNGGQEAWIVRVENDGSAGGGAVAAEAAESTLTTEHGGGADVFRARAGRRLRGEIALDPGSWGNFIRLDVDYDTAEAGRLFNLTASEVRIDGDRTTVLQTETFRNLTLEPGTANNALDVVNQGSRLVQLDRDGMADVPAMPPPFRPAATGTLGGDLPASVPVEADIDTLDVTLELDSGATSIGPIAVMFNFGPANSAPTTFSGWAQALERALRAAATDPALSLAERPYLAGATVSIVGTGTAANPRRFVVYAGRGARPFDPSATLAFGDADAVNYLLDAGSASIGPQQIVLDGGVDGDVLDAAQSFVVPASVFQGVRSARTGLYALEEVDLFNILCMPQVALMPAGDMRAVYTEAEIYAEERRSMIIVDIAPDVQRLDHMQAWLADNEGLRHPNGAVYFPRTNVPDPLNRNRPRSLAASGTIAGLWARTDTQRGVWKAPAGTDARLRNVESLVYSLTDPENGALNPLGVNALRTFPVYAHVCWGARTLEGADVIASDFKYIPVRRTTLFLEESLFRGTKWVVFEPNDEPLWAQIRLNLGAFMQDLFRQGAFQGTTPREAYFVKCDSETTTQTDIDNGIVNIEVGFAPLKPAEFVIIKIQQIVRQAEA
jgi:phage tail sheath protein FI